MIDNHQQWLRFALIGIGAVLFLYAVGLFLIRLLIALAGLFLIFLGLSNDTSFFALRRFYYRNYRR